MALDNAVGQVLTSLKSRGLRDNTLVIFMSDNGPARFDTTPSARYIGPGSNGGLPGFKNQVDEGGIRVPALFSFPNLIRKNRVTDVAGSILDIFPTLVDVMRPPTVLPASELLPWATIRVAARPSRTALAFSRSCTAPSSSRASAPLGLWLPVEIRS